MWGFASPSVRLSPSAWPYASPCRCPATADLGRRRRPRCARRRWRPDSGKSRTPRKRGHGSTGRHRRPRLFHCSRCPPAGRMRATRPHRVDPQPGEDAGSTPPRGASPTPPRHSTEVVPGRRARCRVADLDFGGNVDFRGSRPMADSSRLDSAPAVGGFPRENRRDLYRLIHLRRFLGARGRCVPTRTASSCRGSGVRLPRYAPRGAPPCPPGAEAYVKAAPAPLTGRQRTSSSGSEGLRPGATRLCPSGANDHGAPGHRCSWGKSGSTQLWWIEGYRVSFQNPPLLVPAAS